jgi:uncharacterized protein (TIGR00369 family)
MAESLASVEDLNAVLGEAPFARTYGYRVLDCAHGACELLVPYDESIERPDGIISAMAIMGAADVAMWLAVMTLRGLGETWVTSDMQTSFLRSGRDESVVCKATVLRLGRRTAFGCVECRGQTSGDLLAHHSVRYARVTGEERG